MVSPHARRQGEPLPRPSRHVAPATSSMSVAEGTAAGWSELLAPWPHARGCTGLWPARGTLPSPPAQTRARDPADTNSLPCLETRGSKCPFWDRVSLMATPPCPEPHRSLVWWRAAAQGLGDPRTQRTPGRLLSPPHPFQLSMSPNDIFLHRVVKDRPTVVVVVVVVWTHYCLKSCRKPTAALQTKLE